MLLPRPLRCGSIKRLNARTTILTTLVRRRINACKRKCKLLAYRALGIAYLIACVPDICCV